MSQFQVYGPVRIPVYKMPRARVVAKDLVEFWEDNEDIEDCCGCYVFAMKSGRSVTPIYIGKATKTFSQECFTSHKRLYYNEALGEYLRGTPLMFFVYQIGRPNVYDIKSLERFLIRIGKARNSDLKNRKGIKQDLWAISGVIRSAQGRRSEAAKVFKILMGLD